MKKIKLLLLFALFLSILTNSNAQTDRKLTKGFSINFVTGFPSLAYGSDTDVEADVAYGSMFGFKLGNRWYFSPTEKAGIGLMANWVDITAAYKSGTDWNRATIDFSLLELGPIGTIVVANDIAIDGYYNLRPTVFGSAIVTTGVSDESLVYTGFGFSHALGAAFRWKALNVGFEYVMGSINCQGTTSGSTSLTLDKIDLKTNSFRILLGAKF